MFSAGVGFIGGGEWGRALAAAATRTQSPAVLFSRRGPGSVRVADGVDVVDGLAELAREARLIVLAVPSEVLREVARELGNVVDGRHLIVHASRGLDRDSLVPLSEVVRAETPAKRLGAIGGPVLARDLLDGKPSVLVSGSHYPEVNEAVVAAFGGPMLRVYTTGDLAGLESASAFTGCLAVGVGYAQRLGMGAGIVATLICRGIEEAARLAAATGGNERTLLGLAGYGDLLAAIAQEQRPEIVFGGALAEGKSVQDALALAKARIEAVELIPRVAAWAEARGVPCPIFQGLAARLRDPISASELIERLMTSPRQMLA